MELFLATTTEHSNLLKAWDSEVAPFLGEPGGAWLEIGPGEGGHITRLRVASHYDAGVGVEPDLSLHEPLARNVPKLRVIGKLMQDATDEEILARLPTEADGAKRKHFRLAFLQHSLYYVNTEQGVEWLRRAANLLAPGGAIVAVMQAADSDYRRMFKAMFGVDQTSLEDVTAAFLEAHPGWQVHRISVPAVNRHANFSDALAVADFMLSYLPELGMPPRSAVTAYIEEHFRVPADTHKYEAQSNQLVVVLVKPLA